MAEAEVFRVAVFAWLQCLTCHIVHLPCSPVGAHKDVKS